MELEYEKMHQVARSLYEESLSSIDERISPQTGFFHFHKESYGGKPSFSIPFYENFLVVLLLLRTKNHDHVLEAKRLLLALLRFETQGSFPQMLHEYPSPAYPTHAVLTLAALWQIATDFKSVLGAGLHSEIERCISNLFMACQSFYREQSGSTWHGVLFALLEVVSERREEASFIEWVRSSQWLISKWPQDIQGSSYILMLLERTSSVCDQLFYFLFNNMRHLVHDEWKRTTSYGIGVVSYGENSVLHAFDYYMATRLGWSHLETCSVPFCLDAAWLAPSTFWRNEKKDDSWNHPQYVSESFSTLEFRAILSKMENEYTQECSDLNVHTYHPIRLCTALSSPVIHFPQGTLIRVQRSENVLACMVHFSERIFALQPLVRLFIEKQASFQGEATGLTASCWQEKEAVLVAFGECKIKLWLDNVFSNRFSLRRGNRLGQLIKKNALAEAGFDWMLESVTTIERPANAVWTFYIEVLSG